MRVAFLEEETGVRIRTGRIACLLVFFLMPLGSLVDLLLYPEHAVEFLKFRLLCSLLIVGLWRLHYTDSIRRFYPLVGMPIVILPATFMCLMMLASDEGVACRYYAALNLILLAVSTVGRWSVGETLFAVASVTFLYGLTYAASPTVLYDIMPQDLYEKVAATHLYFILLTGLIAICGNYLFNKVRFSEFHARWDLNVKQRELQDANRQLERVNVQLKEKQAQLVQQEKMASLGKMSAGIAHEINNPLNYVKMNLFTLRKKSSLIAPEQQPKYQQLVDAVEEGVNRVKTIVSDLRTFSHPDEVGRDQVEISEVIASVSRFLSTEIQDRAELKVQVEPDLSIWANKNKLIQVILNLVQNSLDALRTKEFTGGEKPCISISGRSENGRSFITIRDNGPGIPEEHRAKIYDPFFTTKDIGQGMGLGLSICYGIVQEFEGTIHLRTEPGQFCEFTLDFPAKGKNHPH